MQLFFNLRELLFLSTGIALNPFNSHMRVVVLFRNNIKNFFFIYAELVSTCHTDQCMNRNVFFFCTHFQKFQMLPGFDCIHTCIPVSMHRMGNVAFFLIHTGQYNSLHWNSDCLTNVKFSWGTYLEFVCRIL